MLFAKLVSVHSVLQTRRKQGSAVVILMALYQEQTVVQQAMLSSGIKMMYTGFTALIACRRYQAMSGACCCNTDVLQANGFQRKMCLCPRHISCADTPDQYGTQANTADLSKRNGKARYIGHQTYHHSAQLYRHPSQQYSNLQHQLDTHVVTSTKTHVHDPALQELPVSVHNL